MPEEQTRDSSKTNHRPCGECRQCIAVDRLMREAQRVIAAYDRLGRADAEGRESTTVLLNALRGLGYAHEDVKAAMSVPPEHRGPFWRDTLPEDPSELDL